MAFSPDGKRIVSGNGDRTVRVWDAESGEEMLTLIGHTSWVSSVAFSPDGRRIVSGSGGWELKVWDAESGQEMMTLNGHTGSVNSVAFSPDGRRIVSGGYDKTLKVWDASLSAKNDPKYLNMAGSKFIFTPIRTAKEYELGFHYAEAACRITPA